jgi:S-formylglutathione hydrolase FrmB
MKYLFIGSIQLLFSLSLFAQQVDTINIYSPGMAKMVKTVVITPAAYSGNHRANYPVVYLLHGYAGNHTDWIRLVPSIKYLANAGQCIIVSPDAGNSWYLNSPAIRQSKYETFMTVEIVRAIDSAYKTISRSNKRAITGLSMGGHGALLLALKYPGIFGAAGSMSGGLDLRPFMNQYELNTLITDTTVNDFSWKNYSVLQLADSNNARSLKMIIDCGVDDFFIETNRALHQKLLLQKVAHDYIERPGAHNWKYWANAIDYQFLFFRKYFYEKN